MLLFKVKLRFYIEKYTYDCFFILDMNRYWSHLAIRPDKNLLSHFYIEFAAIYIVLDHKITFHDDTSCYSNAVEMLCDIFIQIITELFFVYVWLSLANDRLDYTTLGLYTLFDNFVECINIYFNMIFLSLLIS